MKLIKRFVFILLIILVPILSSCEKKEKYDPYLDDQACCYSMSDLFWGGYIRPENENKKKIYYFNEGYNYYVDLQLLINDNVIFDTADYNYFIPATEDLCIPVELTKGNEYFLTVVFGERFIKTASERSDITGHIDTTYNSGEIRNLYGFDNDVDIPNDIELVEGNSKFVFKGYTGYLYINNDAVTVKKDTSWAAVINDIHGLQINVFDVEAKSACTIKEDDVKYSAVSSEIMAFANSDGSALEIDSNMFLFEEDQFMYYSIHYNPLADNKTLYVEFDSHISIKKLTINDGSSSSIGYANGKTRIEFRLNYPRYAYVNLVLVSTAGVDADISVYKI